MYRYIPKHWTFVGRDVDQIFGPAIMRGLLTLYEVGVKDEICEAYDDVLNSSLIMTNK